ncbi:MAG: TatD family hydrolase [Candidatus Diapherotrites archaeon]
MLIDAHCHLYEFSDAEKIIKEAELKGVKLIISNSVDLNSMKKNLELQKSFPSVKACLGLHPSNILGMKEKEIEESVQFIEGHARECIGIGETGLDFKHATTREQKEFQKKVFGEMLSIAQKEGKAVEVHSREAQNEAIEMLKERKQEKVLLHWLSGGKEVFEKAIECNYFISFGPSVLYYSSTQKMAGLTPLELILLETDAPVEFNGIKAEPSVVKKVAVKIAEIKGLSFEEVERATYLNARKLFNL